MLMLVFTYVYKLSRFMNNFSRKLLLTALICCISPVGAAVEISHLDYDSLLTNDCSRAAITISSTYESQLQQLRNENTETKALIDDSTLVNRFPQLSIDGQSKTYNDFLLPNKNISQNNTKSPNTRLSYFWQTSDFEWFTAYRSNQSSLSPRPYLALMRINKQTWASASALLSHPQQLTTLLMDDFIQQRSPLLLFVSSEQAFRQSDLARLKAQHFKVHQFGQQLIASKNIPVCDSGYIGDQKSNRLAWIKIDLAQ
ncbi:hypothetical protein [Agarivorans sp. Z349TD_8]|uniref:hypothetical protein n=1 Tax=Agarivorans sp. Z349TD_8 TaxID=3421434 RepID=UPI003D7E8931